MKKLRSSSRNTKQPSSLSTTEKVQKEKEEQKEQPGFFQKYWYIIVPLVLMSLINGVSGKVVYKFFEKKVRLDLPVDMILSENNFIALFNRVTPAGLSQ